MWHKHRTWRPHKTTLADAAETLAKFDSMTACTAFEFTHDGERCLLLNDSTGPDAIQEYAVVLFEDGQGLQVESLTTTWIIERGGAEALAASVAEAVKARKGHAVAMQLDYRPDHRCPECM